MIWKIFVKEIVSKLCDANRDNTLKRTLTNISEDFYEEEYSGEKDKFFLPGNKQERKTAVTFENS